MQPSAANATSHREPSPFAYFISASASSTSAAANTTQASGPPMISTTTASTATTTLHTITSTCHAFDTAELKFSHHEFGLIPASAASWMRDFARSAAPSRRSAASRASFFARSSSCWASPTCDCRPLTRDWAACWLRSAERTWSGSGAVPPAGGLCNRSYDDEAELSEPCADDSCPCSESSRARAARPATSARSACACAPSRSSAHEPSAAEHWW